LAAVYDGASTELEAADAIALDSCRILTTTRQSHHDQSRGLQVRAVRLVARRRDHGTAS
jgi:hypothetical protein